MGKKLGEYEEFRVEAILSKLDGDPLLCVDPGDSTGLAWFNRGKHYPRVWTCTLSYTTLMDELSAAKLDYQIVCEQFVSRPAIYAKNQLGAKVCGICEYLGVVMGIPIVYQQPSTIKTMLPDKSVLKELGWTWQTPHELDAIRHGIYYTLTNL